MPMPLGINRKKMGDSHENFLAKLFGGRKSRGSGNQWREPADGRHKHHDPYAFAWDGKSTQGASMSITRAMIDKIIEQAGGERPMIGIRFYDNYALDVAYDWVAVRAEDLSEMREELLELREDVEISDEKLSELNGITVKLEQRVGHWQRKAEELERELTVAQQRLSLR